MDIIRPDFPVQGHQEDTFGNGDQALHIPNFSASSTPLEDEVISIIIINNLFSVFFVHSLMFCFNSEHLNEKRYCHKTY